MRLTISHTTDYTFEEPPAYGLQQVRLSPKASAGQVIVDWDVDITGGQTQAIFEDHNNNKVHLIGLNDGETSISIRSHGSIDMTEQNGIVGKHGGFAPLWYFERQSALTQPGKGVAQLIKNLGGASSDAVSHLHTLCQLIGDRVEYMTGKTDAETTAEGAITAKAGVCQDHAHIFVSVARELGFPARYVSGYLMMDDRVDQDATHAWAEAWIPDLGWTGFDVSNRISPDMRYVRVATGLDYSEASPISGLTYGGSGESISVAVQVQQ